MAVDTTKVRWSGAAVSDSIIRDIMSREEVSNFGYREQAVIPGHKPWRAWLWTEAGVGTMSLVDRESGTLLWVEGSLGKFINGHNQELLTEEAVHDGYSALMGYVEREFGSLFVGDQPLRERAECARVDGYYQQDVGSSPAVLLSLAQALGNRAKINQYASSLELKQSRELMGRWYDKGLESGNEQLVNTLRHEEQIRPHNRAGYFVDCASGRVNFEALRCHMNKRYQNWPDGGLEVPDIASLVEEHGRIGLEAAALILCPALEPVAYRSMARGSFYKRRALMQEFSQRKVRVDLRVPENAWK